MDRRQLQGQGALAAARALHTALSEGRHGEALRPLFTDDLEIVERPNRLKPTGARLDLAGALAASTAGAALLAVQRYEVHSAIEQGSSAALQLTWTGEVARDVGPFRAGQRLVAHIAQFVEVRGGRIARIETYDCYEPFPPA